MVADNAAAVRKIVDLRDWWDRIHVCTSGPGFGYFPKASKTWLVTKEGFYDAAVSIFTNTGVNVALNGRPYLGAAIGSQEYVAGQVELKVNEWISNIQCLATIAVTQPHAPFSALTHGLMSAKGGFPSIRHSEICNLTATLLTEVCHGVSTEPRLQHVTNEVLMGASPNCQDGAWLDIAANGFWGGTFEKTFINVRVFNPHALSNRHIQLSSCYRKHEQMKKRAYEQRIREDEHASFTPLVISATGGLANEANTFYKRLASLLAPKWDHPYSSTLCWLRCTLAFSLCSAIQAIRGAWSSSGHAIRIPTVVNLVNVESNISPDV